VAVVLAAADYPETPRKGDAISGLAEASAAGATVFHAGTVRDAAGTFRTSGGRVLAVVGLGTTIPAARACAEEAADLISWDGMQRRHDIAAVLPPAVAAAATSPDPVSESAWTKGASTVRVAPPTAPGGSETSPHERGAGSPGAISTTREGDL
jgi:phosphoribosylamine--glycine ligase